MGTKPLREWLAEMPFGSCLEVRDVADLEAFRRRLDEEAQALGISVQSKRVGSPVRVLVD